MSSDLGSKTAIAGIGATEFSKNSGRSEMKLALEAVTAALDDAGIDRREVDGLVTFTMDNNIEIEVARGLGARDLKFFSRPHYGGGGGCGGVLHAALAVAAGVSDVCVVYRAMNERSQYRFGQPMGGFAAPTSENVLLAYHSIHGVTTAAAFIAMAMRRYMHETGTTSLDFADLAVTQRKHASTNPKAFFYGLPVTIEQHQQSRMIADPFRLLDCCQESDGAVAVVVVSAERAKSLRQKPAIIRAASQSSPKGQMNLTSWYRDDIAPLDEVALSGRQLYDMARLTPGDIRMAILYDHFAPTILPSIEGLGFCRKGEAKDFIKNGNIGVGGRLPVNTNGGQVGEAYIHGMNGIAEAVRQIRGTAANQVSDVNNVIVTSGSAVPTSGLILWAA
jgi:acetyl-CoA acetyltransferase